MKLKISLVKVNIQLNLEYSNVVMVVDKSCINLVWRLNNKALKITISTSIC